jgi:catechol 2,3-dioxygenase-like lactoylglutathione lyase family enzyme
MNTAVAPSPLLGVHHVTAIAGDPQDNLDFYAGVLGLRLVKKTVNFDDPGTYHLYFGDEVGHPGTIMTFFPWPGAPRGRHGTGQLTGTAFATSPDSLGYWSERLEKNGATVERRTTLGEALLSFQDPDGLELEIVGVPGPTNAADAHALRGFAQVTLAEEGYEATARLLTEVMGFKLIAESGNLFRYAAAADGVGTRVDVLCMPDAIPGRVAVGTVHHVAFRTATDAAQREWRALLAERGFNVSPVLDRQYFHSIYYREPGGVLFEIATDPPGFTVDEPRDELGTTLTLPPRLESSRRRIEAALPPLEAVRTHA